MADYVAGREEKSSNIWTDPMGLDLSTPSIDQKADRTKYRTNEHKRNSKFRFANVVVTSFEITIDSIVQGGSDLGTKPKADSFKY
jgi:hypothetical protein